MDRTTLYSESSVGGGATMEKGGGNGMVVAERWGYKDGRGMYDGRRLGMGLAWWSRSET